MKGSLYIWRIWELSKDEDLARSDSLVHVIHLAIYKGELFTYFGRSENAKRKRIIPIFVNLLGDAAWLLIFPLLVYLLDFNVRRGCCVYLDFMYLRWFWLFSDLLILWRSLDSTSRATKFGSFFDLEIVFLIFYYLLSF